MRRILLSLLTAGLPFLTVSAHGQSRPSTPALSCAQAQGLVQSRGAIVLGTGPYTYDRYVAHRGFCGPTESVRPAWAPTRDNPQCFVGYLCRDVDIDDF